MTRQEIAKKAYQQIVKAIIDLEEKYQITCKVPEFIEIDGQKFYKGDLHLHSMNIPDEFSFPVSDEIVKPDESNIIDLCGKDICPECQQKILDAISGKKDNFFEK